VYFPTTGKVFLTTSNPSTKEAVANTELRLKGKLIIRGFNYLLMNKEATFVGLYPHLKKSFKVHIVSYFKSNQLVLSIISSIQFCIVEGYFSNSARRTLILSTFILLIREF
jgi:hypothetical protein